MSASARFNYIVTIHNKERLIGEVLSHLAACATEHSHLYPVLDGCTDGTEKIVDDFARGHPRLKLTKIHTPDVHEILSINAGLTRSDQSGEGYNIILQDDVLLEDHRLEEKITRLYQYAGPQLGFVSFRHGANLAPAEPGCYPFKDYVESAFGHGLPDATILLPGQFAYRAVAIKSPVCLPFAVVRKVGRLDERLAPYMCDDVEYSLRCLEAGFRNAVFALQFRSDVEWGTTRTNPDSRHAELERRNLKLIAEWHRDTLARFRDSELPTLIEEVPAMASLEDQTLAQNRLRRNQAQLRRFMDRTAGRSLLGRVRNRIRRLGRR